MFYTLNSKITVNLKIRVQIRADLSFQIRQKNKSDTAPAYTQQNISYSLYKITMQRDSETFSKRPCRL